MPAKQVLIVEDERPIREMIAFGLRRAGFEVREAEDCRSARLQLADRRPDVLLVDWMLPDMSGLELTRALKRDRDTRELPIILLTARAEESDRVAGLEGGADDYITKPFSPRELVARVKAVLRRVESKDDAGEPRKRKLRHGNITIDPERHEVFWKNELITLTPTELGLLAALLERPGVVLSRGQLMQRAYSYDNLVTERTIDTHVRRIRAKFRAVGGDDPIATVHGVGYKAAEA